MKHANVKPQIELVSSGEVASISGRSNFVRMNKTIGGNDPHLSFNNTTVEVTSDNSIEPNIIGFTVVQNTTTNINVTNATYIFLALA